MNDADIKKKVAEIKKQSKEFLSNIYPGKLDSGDYDVIEQDGAIFVFVEEPFRKVGLFAAKDKETLVQILRGIPSGIMIEWIYRDENILKEIMEEAGIQEYTMYIRRTYTYCNNPYQIPESGKRKLLQDLYDPDRGEYPVDEDAEELYDLAQSVFDVNCDEIFSVEQWRDRIRKKEVLVYREADKIIACYVWRQEGKKLYSNISINTGPANCLYNLERRVFEQMWEKGIKTHYFWRNNFRKKVRLHYETSIECIDKEDILYNMIYLS